MTSRAAAPAHPAPDARRDFMLLVLFVTALQVAIVVSAARAVDAASAMLRDRLPAASDTILPEAPKPPLTRLATI